MDKRELEALRRETAEASELKNIHEVLIKKERHAALVSAFNEIDIDGSGWISEAELLPLLGRVFPEVGPQYIKQYAQVILRESDGNADKMISLGEWLKSDFLQLMHEGAQLDAAQEAARLEEAFKSIDTDGSNFIDAYELVGLLEKVFPDVPDQTRKLYYRKIIEDCDKNGDGVIALDEFLRCNFTLALTTKERKFRSPTGFVSGSPTSANLRAGSPRSPGSVGSRSVTPAMMLGTRPEDRVAMKKPREVGMPTFASTASAKSNIEIVIAELKYTMEDYRKWDRPGVRKFVEDLSVGCSLLQKELAANLYAFNEIDGSQLPGMSDDDLATLGVTYKTRHLFVDALRRLEANEDSNSKKREKAKQLLDAFLASDLDQSGTIDQGEIKSVVCATFPGTSDCMAELFYTVLLRECDPESKGVIDLKALMAANHEFIMMKVMSEAEKAEIVEEAFNAMDVDGSGELERAELEKLVDISFPNAGPTVKRKYYQTIVRECDKDNSGTVGLQEIFKSEFVSLMTELPRRAGTDDDDDTVLPMFKSVEARCVPTSPRRKEPVSTSYTVPHVDKFEEHDFQPKCENAQALIDKAEQLLELDPSAHWSAAQEYFEDAAKLFAASRMWDLSGQAFERSSDCYEKLGRPLESASALRDAADSYRHVSALDAAQCYKEAAEVYLKEKKPRMAARSYRSIAQTYEEADDFENAIDWFSNAANTFPPADAVAISGCHQRVAVMYSYIDMLHECRVYAKKVVDQCLADNAQAKATIPLDVARLFQFAVLLLDLSMLDVEKGTERLKGLTEAQADLDTYCEIEDTKKEQDFARHLVQCVKGDLSLTVLQTGVAAFGAEREMDKWVEYLLGMVRDNIVRWHRTRDDQCATHIAQSEQRVLLLH